jgi:glutaredoxin domain-containing cysteine-rich protein 1
LKARRIEDEDDLNEDPFFGFEEKCPPGGTDSVILYTTTLRGIRKTFGRRKTNLA